MLKEYSQKLSRNTLIRLNVESKQLIDSLKKARHDFTTYLDFYKYALDKVLRKTAGIEGISYYEPNAEVLITSGKCRSKLKQELSNNITIYYHPPLKKGESRLDKVQYKAIKTLSALKEILQNVRAICDLHHNEIESIGAKKESLLKDVLYYRSKYLPNQPFGLIRLGWPQLGHANVEYGHILQDVFLAMFMTDHTLKEFNDCELIRMGADCLVYVRGDTNKEVTRKLENLSARVMDIGNILLKHKTKPAFQKAVEKYLRKNEESENKIKYVLENIGNSMLLSDFFTRHKINKPLNAISILFEKFSDNPREFIGLIRLLDEINPAFEKYKEYVDSRLILNINQDNEPGTEIKLSDRIKDFSNNSLNEFGMIYDDVYFIDKDQVGARYNVLLRGLELSGKDLYQEWNYLKTSNPEMFAYLYGDIELDDLAPEEKINYQFLDRYYSQIYRMKDPKGTTPFFSKGTHELFNVFMEDNLVWQKMLFQKETSAENEELLWSIAEKYGKKYHLDPGMARVRLDILLHRFKADGCLFFRTGGDEFRVIAREKDNAVGVLDCDFNKLSGFMIFRPILGDIAVWLISRRIRELFLMNTSNNKEAGQETEYDLIEAMNLALLDLNRKTLEDGTPNPNYKPLKVPLSYFGDLDRTLTDKKGKKLKSVRIKIPNSPQSRSYIYAITEEELGQQNYTKNIFRNFIHELIKNEAMTEAQINKVSWPEHMEKNVLVESISARWLLYFSGLDLNTLQNDIDAGKDPEIDILTIMRMNVKGLSTDQDNDNLSFAFVHHLSLSMGYIKYPGQDFLKCLNSAVEYSELAKKYNDLSILGGNNIIYRRKIDANGNLHWIVKFDDEKGIAHRLLLLQDDLREEERKRRAGRQNNATVYEITPEEKERLAQLGINDLEGKIIFIQ